MTTTQATFTLGYDNAGVRALASYCHTIMNSAEFLYLD